MSSDYNKRQFSDISEISLRVWVNTSFNRFVRAQKSKLRRLNNLTMRKLGSLLLFMLLMCAIRALSADYSWNELAQNLMKSEAEKSKISGARKHHVNVEQKHSTDGVTCPDCEDGSVCCRRGDRFACCLSVSMKLGPINSIHSESEK